MTNLGPVGSLRVGVTGYGTIGRAVTDVLSRGIDGLELTALGLRGGMGGRSRPQELPDEVAIVDSRALADRCDVIVDCCPSQAFEHIVRPALAGGRSVITPNGTAILLSPELVAMAARGQGRLILASGSILGLDAIKAAAEGTIHEVSVVTRKPPASLAKSGLMADLGLDTKNLRSPVRLFSGSVLEGAVAFPANVNVAAAIALAGIGAERTLLEVWADPALFRNTHTVTVNADSARFMMTIENIPTASNPATGRLTALSLVTALRRLVAGFQVGS